MNSTTIDQSNETAYYANNNQYQYSQGNTITSNLPPRPDNYGNDNNFSFKKPYENEEDVDSDGIKDGKENKRKIKIEYIKDKSRRHITFSKRKAGIMKKAYELSVLTGTQVLLLVVSETGLVYTFTTPKLQPIVTKPEGKGLIQACLNVPDPQTMQLEAQRAAAAANHYQYYNEVNRSQNRLPYDATKSSPDKNNMTPACAPPPAINSGYFGYASHYPQPNLHSPGPLSVNTNIGNMYTPPQISPYGAQGFSKLGPNGTTEYWSSQASGSPLPSPGIPQLPGKGNKDN